MEAMQPPDSGPSPQAAASPRFASALSTREDLGQAREEATERLLATLDGKTPDLLLVFTSPHHRSGLGTLGPTLAHTIGPEHLLGCTGASIVGGSREVENEPALSLWAAYLPDTRIAPFAVEAVAAGPDGGPLFSGAPDVDSAEPSSLLVVADPFALPAEAWLRRLNEDLPGVTAVGGLSSGGRGPGTAPLFDADGIRRVGALGFAISGKVEMRSVVSQGCRPVAQSWVVTKCEDNQILGLGGRKASEVLIDTLRSLPPEVAPLFQRQPFLGLAIDANKSEFERGDLLARPILGLDPKAGTVSVGARVRAGQTVQFLVRDADSAGEDLAQLLREHGGGPVKRAGEHWDVGALLFSCNGRGTRLFPVPDHDVRCLQSGLEAELPVGGFFAGGEIGPVGGQNFLHGFTASVALFRRRGS